MQPINIEQRGKPRYLGMHVIEKWKTRQTIWCPPNKTLARRYKLPFDRFFLTEPDSMLPKREDPGHTLRIYHHLFFLGLLPFRHCPLCLLKTASDRLFAAHQRRHGPDIAHWPRIRRSALEYPGWLRAGMVIKISRDARRQEAGEGERLEDVRVRIGSVSRLLRYRLNYSSKPLADLLRWLRMGDVT